MPTHSEELRRRIVADINSGAYAPGAKLGSERDLAEHYGTSRSSLRQVLAALEAVTYEQRARLRRAGAHVAAHRAGLRGAVVRLDLIALAPGRRPRHVVNAWMGDQ